MFIFYTPKLDNPSPPPILFGLFGLFRSYLILSNPRGSKDLNGVNKVESFTSKFAPWMLNDSPAAYLKAFLALNWLMIVYTFLFCCCVKSFGIKNPEGEGVLIPSEPVGAVWNIITLSSAFVLLLIVKL